MSQGKQRRKSNATTAKVEIADPWDETVKTERSQNFLAAMADKVRKNHEAGKTKRGGFGKE